MSDTEIELSIEQDLLPVLRGVMSIVEKRARKLPEQHALSIEARGVKQRQQTLRVLKSGFNKLAKDLKTGSITANDFSRKLDEFEQGLKPHQRSQLALYDIKQLRNVLERDDGLLHAAAMLAHTVFTIDGVINDTIDHSKTIQTRLTTLKGSERDAMAPLNQAIALLESDISEEKIKQRNKEFMTATKALEKFRRTLENSQIAETVEGEKIRREKLIRLETAVEEADPQALVLKAMQSVYERVPADDHMSRQLLGGLVDEAKVVVLNRAAARRTRGLEESIEELNRAGGTITRSFNVAVGAEAGALGSLASVSATLGYGFTLQLRRTADGGYQIRRTHAVKLKGKGKAGQEDAAQATLTAQTGVSGSEWRTYGSIEDLVTVESNTMLNVAMGSGRGAGRDARKFINDRHALHQRVMTNRAQFVEQLKRADALQLLPSERQKLPIKPLDVEQVDRLRSTAHAINASFAASGDVGFTPKDASVGHGSLSGSGEISVSAERRKDFKVLSYLEDLSGNPDAQAIELKTGNTVIRRMGEHNQLESHAATAHYYNTLHERSQLLNEMLQSDALTDDDRVGIQAQTEEIQKRVKSDLNRLEAEYSLFTRIKQQRDLVNESQAAAGTDKLYMQLLQQRGISGSGKTAKYIRAMTLQYAVLSNLYRESTASVADADGEFADNMQAFEHALRVPPVVLDEKSRRAVFGDEASTDDWRVRSIKLAVSASFGGAGETAASTNESGNSTTSLGQFGGVSGTFSASITYLNTKKKGEPNSSAVNISIDFSLGSLGLGAGNENKISDTFSETLAGNMATRLLDGKVIRKIPFIQQSSREEAVATLTQAILATARHGSGHLEVKYIKVDGQWRLKTVASVESSTVDFSVSGKIPASAAANVLIEASVSQQKSRVQQIYYGSQTLSGLTDILRFRQREAGGVNVNDWASVRKKSRVLEEKLKSLVNNGEIGQTQNGDKLDTVLQKIKNGDIKEPDKKQWMLKKTGTNNSIGIANELIPWLFALKNNGQVEIANRFIDGYIKHQGLLASAQSGNDNASDAEKQEQQKAMQAVEALFAEVVVAKRTIEDTQADSGFIRRRSMTRKTLNEHIVKRLAEAFSDLDLRVSEQLEGVNEPVELTEPGSLKRLKKRLLKAYENNPDIKTYNLIKDTLSLEHVAESLDDLTRYNYDKDKESALAQLSQRLDTVFTDHRVYMTDKMDGRIRRLKDGRLSISPLTDEQGARILTRKEIDREVQRLSDSNEDSAVLRYSNNARVKLDNGRIKTWKESFSDEDARDDFNRRRSAASGLLNVSLFNKKKKRKKKKSISEMLEKVLQANAEKQQQLRRLRRLRRNQAKEAAQEVA